MHVQQQVIDWAPDCKPLMCCLLPSKSTIKVTIINACVLAKFMQALQIVIVAHRTYCKLHCLQLCSSAAFKLEVLSTKTVDIASEMYVNALQSIVQPNTALLGCTLHHNISMSGLQISASLGKCIWDPFYLGDCLKLQKTVHLAHCKLSVNWLLSRIDHNRLPGHCWWLIWCMHCCKLLTATVDRQSSSL